MVFVSVRLGVPLSVATTLNVNGPPTLARAGANLIVALKTLLASLVVAPMVTNAGAPLSDMVTFWFSGAPLSGSVADTGRLNTVPPVTFTVVGLTVRTGGRFAGVTIT